jgi:hypothetical protein
MTSKLKLKLKMKAQIRAKTFRTTVKKSLSNKLMKYLLIAPMTRKFLKKQKIIKIKIQFRRPQLMMLMLCHSEKLRNNLRTKKCHKVND